jgi:hypothetical protein
LGAQRRAANAVQRAGVRTKGLPTYVTAKVQINRGLIDAGHGGWFGALGVHTLVMVADPNYFAIDFYRAVDFAPTETQIQIERPPADS